LTAAIFLMLAGLMGAGGIILLAAGADLAFMLVMGSSAGYMLLFHAAAVVGGTALLRQEVVWRPPLILVLAGWVLGAGLFSGDVASQAFTGHPLFAMAESTGGTVVIAAWLALAAAGAVERSGAASGADLTFATHGAANS
jgi:uncharacterized membrane protein YgdD (TMEM256/DUF423 family)